LAKFATGLAHAQTPQSTMLCQDLVNQITQITGVGSVDHPVKGGDQFSLAGAELDKAKITFHDHYGIWKNAQILQVYQNWQTYAKELKSPPMEPAISDWVRTMLIKGDANAGIDPAFSADTMNTLNLTPEKIAKTSTANLFALANSKANLATQLYAQEHLIAGDDTSPSGTSDQYIALTGAPINGEQKRVCIFRDSSTQVPSIFIQMKNANGIENTYTKIKFSVDENGKCSTASFDGKGNLWGVQPGNFLYSLDDPKCGQILRRLPLEDKKNLEEMNAVNRAIYGVDSTESDRYDPAFMSTLNEQLKGYQDLCKILKPVLPTNGSPLDQQDPMNPRKAN